MSLNTKNLAGVFEQQIFPVLTPLSVDTAHPFPHISNLSLNLAVVVHDGNGGAPRFARLKVPQLLPRFLMLPDGERFIPVEQVIAAHLSALFPGSEVVAHHPFRVTLDADLAVEEEEAGDLLAAIESGLHRRLRMNDVVRLEVDAGMSTRVRDFLMRALELDPEDVYERRCPLDLSGLLALCDLDRPELKESPWRPITQPRLQPATGEDGGADFFSVLREGDVLVHHPYDSFASSVEAFLTQAANDDGVLAIKSTLYRTSGPD